MDVCTLIAVTTATLALCVKDDCRVIDGRKLCMKIPCEISLPAPQYSCVRPDGTTYGYTRPIDPRESIQTVIRP